MTPTQLRTRLKFRLSYAKRIRVAIYTRDDFTCQMCGWRPETIPDEYDGRYTIGHWPHRETRALEIDHIVPLCKGGTNVEDNLQTLCAPCNMRKGGR